MSQKQPENYLTIDEVVQRTKYARRTIYRMMNAGTFPQNVRLGPHKVAWRESDVNRWLRDRVRRFNPEVA